MGRAVRTRQARRIAASLALPLALAAPLAILPALLPAPLPNAAQAARPSAYAVVVFTPDLTDPRYVRMLEQHAAIVGLWQDYGAVFVGISPGRVPEVVGGAPPAGLDIDTLRRATSFEGGFGTLLVDRTGRALYRAEEPTPRAVLLAKLDEASGGVPVESVFEQAESDIESDADTPTVAAAGPIEAVPEPRLRPTPGPSGEAIASIAPADEGVSGGTPSIAVSVDKQVAVSTVDRQDEAAVSAVPPTHIPKVPGDAALIAAAETDPSGEPEPGMPVPFMRPATQVSLAGARPSETAAAERTATDSGSPTERAGPALAWPDPRPLVARVVGDAADGAVRTAQAGSPDNAPEIERHGDFEGLAYAAPALGTARPAPNPKALDERAVGAIPRVPLPAGLDPVVPDTVLARVRHDVVEGNLASARRRDGFEDGVLAPDLPVRVQAAMRVAAGPLGTSSDLALAPMLLVTGSCGANLDPLPTVAEVERRRTRPGLLAALFGS